MWNSISPRPNYRPCSLSPLIHDRKLNETALSGGSMHGETNEVHLVQNPYIISCQDRGDGSSLVLVNSLWTLVYDYKQQKQLQFDNCSAFEFWFFFIYPSRHCQILKMSPQKKNKQTKNTTIAPLIQKDLNLYVIYNLKLTPYPFLEQHW